MKELILILFLSFIAGNIYIDAQKISRTVISLSGEYKETDGYYISWTSGEPVASTIFSYGYYLTQGFQQPSLLNVSEPHSIPTIDSINVYPNPVRDNLMITFSIKDIRSYRIEIITLEGRKIWMKDIEFPESVYYEEEIDFSSYIKGLYFIHIYSNEKNVNKVFKIEKIKH